MENFELTAEKIGRLLTVEEINQKLHLFSEKHEKILPKTVHNKNEHLITLDLLPIQDSLVKLPVAFRSDIETDPRDYYRKSWRHDVNGKNWTKGQRIKMACAMCDIYFGSSVPRLYDCLKSSLDHSHNSKKPPFVIITDRVKETFNQLPPGTVVVKTSEEYKGNSVELL